MIERASNLLKIVVPDSVLLQNVEGELVLLNLQNEQYYGLDSVGSHMWTALIETGTVEGACQKLLEVYEVESTQINNDLETLLNELLQHGLLEIVST